MDDTNSVGKKNYDYDWHKLISSKAVVSELSVKTHRLWLQSRCKILNNLLVLGV
jgi:hypothetical protein